MHTPTILKRSIAFIAAFLLFAQLSRAQYVTIPDSNFVSWLQAGSYASCMNGNQMDTTCTALVTDTFFDIHFSWIHDLTGVQYLKNVTYMDCDEAQLTYIQAFPPALRELHCFANHLPALPPFPATLIRLYCSHNQIAVMPAFPAGLTYIDCSFNYPMATFASLPAALTYLDCHQDQMSGSLPPLPAGLVYLDASENRFHSLPALPASLQTLRCLYDSLTSLPALPAGLLDLECDVNQITVLPAMPAGLQLLSANYNQLTTTPFLPNSITTVNVANNQLTSIPNLPDSMDLFYCSWNPNLTCLPRLGKVGSLNFNNTAITCLGNYPIPDSNTISNSNPPLSTVPLCTPGNANGCAIFTGIKEISAFSGLSVYPNPVNDILTVSAHTSAPVEITLYDLQGRSLRTIITTSHITEVSTSSLSPGIYMLRLTSKGEVTNRTFIKQ